LILRGTIGVLILVPLLALALVSLVDLPRGARVGIMLMAISPGAPVALRRSLDAGAHGAFAPSLQLVVVTLAVVTLPGSIAVLDWIYAGHASVAPWQVARQVFFAQILPLGIGIGMRAGFPTFAQRLEPRLARLANLLLLALALIVIVDVWELVFSAGIAPLACAVILTFAALGIGHALGRPEPSTRPAMAFCCAMRNPGLALLVANVNHAAPGVTAMILAYLLGSAVVVAAYLAWYRRRFAHTAPAR
jgi:BASS family bile acid:Na+ symporter